MKAHKPTYQNEYCEECYISGNRKYICKDCIFINTFGRIQYHESIETIIKTSQKNNVRQEVGGEIIWNSTKSRIIQILEGPSIYVNELFNIIKTDSRHTNVYAIAIQDIKKEEKQYAVWDASIVKGFPSEYKPNLKDFEIKTVIGNGGDMFELLNNRKLTSGECLFYFFEILSALRYIHKNGIIYRDMKLENILMNNDGHIVCAQPKMLKKDPLAMTLLNIW